jgi:HAD superfamily hydrolase (TIGR01490 family)
VLLAIFDLDNTLLAGDSDVLWTEFLVEQGVLSEDDRRRSDDFYRQYEEGTLDVTEFLEFQLRPLSLQPAEVLHEWRKQFVETHIAPIVLPRGLELLQSHRKSGHYLLIMTATNRFITAPIARLLGVDDLVATEVEMVAGRYTGRSWGVPCFQEGKIERYRLWLEEQGAVAQRTWFYSDSENDIPLLEEVTDPVAVDPDPALAGYAKQKGWPVMSLR